MKSIINPVFAIARMKKLDILSSHSESNKLESHLKGTLEWLFRAQDATPGDGVSSTYSVLHNSWQSSYPETTGYIIETFVRQYKLTGELKFLEIASMNGK